MKKCKFCGGIGEAHTEQVHMFGGSECYIRCTKCGYTTETQFAFWASDARKRADREWEAPVEKINGIWDSEEERKAYYKDLTQVCPLCHNEFTGGHTYKEARICDNCYCDITGMQKVNRYIICG